jgi:hypothetical protein
MLKSGLVVEVRNVEPNSGFDPIWGHIRQSFLGTGPTEPIDHVEQVVSAPRHESEPKPRGEAQLATAFSGR